MGVPLPGRSLPPPKRATALAQVWQHTVYLASTIWRPPMSGCWIFGADKGRVRRGRAVGAVRAQGCWSTRTDRSSRDSSVLSSAWAVARIKDPGPWSPSWGERFTGPGGLRRGEVRDGASGRAARRPPDADHSATCSGLALRRSRRPVHRRTPAPRGRGIGHRLPQQFLLDDLTAVRDPPLRSGTGSALASVPHRRSPAGHRRRASRRSAVVDDGVSLDRLPWTMASTGWR